MEKLKIACDCAECKNEKTCPTTIKNRTKEISDAIRKRYLPIPFIESVLPKNVHMEKECALKRQPITQHSYKRAPKAEWFNCENCFSRNNCKHQEHTQKFIQEKQHIVNGNIHSPLITAPWIDTNVYCDDYHPEM